MGAHIARPRLFGSVVWWAPGVCKWAKAATLDERGCAEARVYRGVVVHREPNDCNIPALRHQHAVAGLEYEQRAVAADPLRGRKRKQHTM